MTEWAEKHRILSSKRSSMPGNFRAWPFQREPMDVCSPHDPTQRIVLMCAVQILKTTVIENLIGCFVQHDPCPIIVWQPREDDVQYFSKTGIDPMFQECPSLRGLVAVKKSRDSGYTINEKQFIGGSLTILGSQEPANFQMRTARVGWVDEIDRAPRMFKGEGSLLAIALNRTANYRDTRKFGVSSTPTLEGDSPIADAYAESDQRRFFVPCPFCNHYQVLVWSSDHAPWPTEGGVVWGDGVAPDDAHYRCESCRELIPNWRKSWMLDRGEWRKGNPKSKIAGFHLSRLYSPITPWGDLAVDFLAALKTDGGLQSFVNTKLAEVWKLQGDCPDWEVIASRAENYEKSTVPHGVLFLTAGVDVQDDRIEVSVYGFGRRKQRWLIDRAVFWGDTGRIDSPAWTQLTEFTDRTWRHVGGAKMSLARTAIDSGHRATQVYDWARARGASRVLVVKGYASGIAIIGTPSTSESNAKRKRRGLLVYPVNVSMAKSELYSQLRASKPKDGEEYPAGWFHHYREEDDFYQQITAEKWVESKDKKGNTTGYWHKTGRNEALDIANYARAAAEFMGWSKWGETAVRRMEAALVDSPDVAGQQAKAEPEVIEAPVVEVKRQAQPVNNRPRGSDWLPRNRRWL